MRYLYITRLCLMVLCFTATMSVKADDGNSLAFFESYEVRDALAKRNKTIYFDNKDLEGMSGTDLSEFVTGSKTTLQYLPNRRALTGESCNINKLINSVGVGSWNDNLGKLLNDDLDDYCSFNAVASVGVTVNPYLSVRDRSCYYAKGCQAGFCIVAGSGNSVLSVDVIKAMAIGFYRDGNLVGTVAVGDGQDTGGVQLSLIQVPGSDDANIYLTAEAPGVFDEISLNPAGGVNISAGQILRIKYAFVGRAREFTVTHNKDNGMYSNDLEKSPYYRYLQSKGIDKDVTFKDSNIKVYNAAVAGLPFPAADKNNFIDENPDNTAKITPILSIGYQGGAKFVMNYVDQRKNGDEIFQKGTEVGFKYDFATVLNIDLGTWIQIVLFDINGNKIHTEEVSAEVLGLSVAGGGAGSTSIIAPLDFSGAEIRFMTTVSVDLGGIGLYYAYIREKPDVRHHCQINPSADTSLCPEQTTYQLKSNPSVSVSWTLERAEMWNGETVTPWTETNVTVTPEGYVSGLPGETIINADEYENTDFVFVFRATAADGCYDDVYIRKGAGLDLYSDEDSNGGLQCGLPLVNASAANPEYQIKRDYSFNGSILSISKTEDLDNVVDDNYSNFAKYIGGFKLGSNLPIVGIEKKDGKDPIHQFKDDSDDIRVGFVVSSVVEGVNLSALQFYQIRLYDKDGKEFLSKVIEESNTVSADIGGSNSAQKVRFSIGIPAVDKDGKRLPDIHAFALWTSGVLDLEGGELDIYYGFVENGLDSECSDPMGCDPQVLSYNHTHTTLDFDMMQGGSAIVVANAVNDLDNMVDDDLNSFTSIANTVSLGDGLPIAIKLGKTADYRQQLGIVMDNKAYVAAVNAGKWLTVETYYNGVATGDKFTDWNAVDANVIGYGDRNVFLVQPKMMYDEVVITLGEIVGALDIIRFYGLFLRSDIDGDGIPDCQDPLSCHTTISEDNVIIDKGCAGDEIGISIINLNTGNYELRLSDPNFDSEKFEITSSDSYTTSYYTKTPGIYQAIVFNEKGVPLVTKTYKVYPTETKWKTDATNRDWNKWDNWTEGSPYCCTNVIIPTGADIYPDLPKSITEDNADLYCCDGIHFEPGAEINHVTNLNYMKAWVDFVLKANRYYNLSVPLQGVVTGDMFIPEASKGVHEGDKFVDLDATNSPENRFNPTIYQRLWDNTEAKEFVLSKKGYTNMGVEDVEVGTMTTQWSRNFNSVKYQYGFGEGFALWVDNGNLPDSQDFRFRLPKIHETYGYYNDLDQTKETDENELKRKGKSGRFIAEYAWKEAPVKSSYTRGSSTKERNVYPGDFTVKVKTDTKTNGEIMALFGNPLMSGISVMELLKANPNVHGVIFQDGTTAQTIKRASDDEEILVNNDTPEVIRPLQSVYLLISNDAVTDESFDVNITQAMISPLASEDAANMAPALRITTKTANAKASLTVADADVMNVMMLDGEVPAEVAVFAVADDGRALDIVPSGFDRLPLSIIKRETDSLTIDFVTSGGFPRDDYELEDLKTGIIYTLDEEVKLPAGVGSSSGRFVLRTASISGVEERLEDENVYLEVNGNEVTAYAASGVITTMMAYDAKGAMIGSARSEGSDCLKMTVPSGICIIRVSTEDKTSSHKIVIPKNF